MLRVRQEKEGDCGSGEKEEEEEGLGLGVGKTERREITLASFTKISGGIFTVNISGISELRGEIWSGRDGWGGGNRFRAKMMN